jgi:hypothetical protein
LRSQRLNELTPTVIESVARIDGAIVLDRESRLIAFGAILRSNATAQRESGATPLVAPPSAPGLRLVAPADLTNRFLN